MVTWMDAAACATSSLPAAAWTEKGTGKWGGLPAHRQALRVCRGCPVALECLIYQLDFEEGRADGKHRSGIFGATTPEQRARLANRRVVARG